MWRGRPAPKTPVMTTTLMPEAPTKAPAPSTSRPLREASTFVGLVAAMILGAAFALPHANIVQLLTMVSPLVAVVLITFTRTPRGQRRKLWGSLGLGRLGLRSWPAALVVSAAIVFVLPYLAADLLGSIAFKPLGTSVDGLAQRSHQPRHGDRVRHGPGPHRGDRLARLPVAASADAGVEAQGRPRRGLHPRDVPRAAHGVHDDVQQRRQPLGRGAHGRGHRHRSGCLLRLAEGPLGQRLAGLVGARHGQRAHRRNRLHRRPVTRRLRAHGNGERLGHHGGSDRRRGPPVGAGRTWGR